MSILLIAFAVPDHSHAQVNTEDSLQLVLEKASSDSSKINVLLQLAWFHGSDEREQAILYYSKALQIEKDIYKSAVILDTIGLFSMNSGDYSEAIDYFKKALILFSELNDSIWLGRIYNNIGVVNWRLGNRNEALKFYQAGLSIRKAIKDLRGVSTILNNIGLIYQDWGLYDEAFNWHMEALKIAQDLEDINLIAYSYSNIGECFENKKDLKQALYYLMLGFETLIKSDDNEDSYSYYFANIGDIYSKIGPLDSALSYYQRSFLYANRMNSKHRLAIAEYNLGRTFLTLNRLDSARHFIDRSLSNSLENNYPVLIIDNQFVLAEIEEKSGNFPVAFTYFKHASNLKDSLIDKEGVGKFTELQIEYHLAQEEQEKILLRKNIEIQELTIRKQNNARMIYIAGSILILVVLAFIAKSRSSFRKLSIQLQQSESDLKRSNANKDKFFSIISHDLKSPFHSLIGIINILDYKYDKLSTEKVKNYIKLLKDNSSKIYNLLEGLLEWVQTQSERLEYRFENVDYYGICDNVIGTLNSVAQNKMIFVENRVKEDTVVFVDVKAIETVTRNIIANAIKFTESEGKVIIEAEQSGNEMIISITDTGVGMSEKVRKKLFRIESQHTSVGTNNETGTGLGLILCKELIENQEGKIWVESELGQGSKFIFTVRSKR